MSTKLSVLLPVFCLLIAATLWGVSWYPLRILEGNGLHGLWTSVLVFGIPALLGSIVLFPRRGEILREPWLLSVIAIGNAWCNVAFILAVLDGNVMRVLLLFYLSPLWATLLGWLVLREHLSGLAKATLALAMFGAVIMLWDPAMGMPWPQNSADWLAISSGMAFAIANVAVRKAQDISIPIKNLSSWWGVAVLAMVWISIADISMPRLSPQVLTATIVIGPLLILVMTYTVQYGVTKLPVYRSAVILLFELVAGAISTQWLSDEVMKLEEWVGGSLIIVAAYLSARYAVDNNAQQSVSGELRKALNK